ncbi:MAG: nucleoside-diphosphate kinase [Candidatus Omnitrophota bacterium]
MKEPVLVIIKPDGISKGLTGPIFTKFSQADLEIVAIKIAKSNRTLIEKHYDHLKKEPFFNDVISYLLGEGYKRKKLLAVIYYGEGAIKKCRKIAGATNPEDAHPFSIRGSYGRITTKGLFENVVHVSSDKKEAKREIKLWFDPNEITRDLYPTDIIRISSLKKRIWK